MRNSQFIQILGMAQALSTPPFMDVGSNAPAIKYAKAKPKQKIPGSRALRGYYPRYTHSLSEYMAEKNQAKIANGKTGFKGFRKVRKFIPENGMSVWVKA
jgi:hypothetical protein